MISNAETLLLVCVFCLAPDVAAQRRINNESGRPIRILNITDSKGKQVGGLYITGKDAFLDSWGRLTKGAGYVQAVPGEHVNVSTIIRRSKPKEGAFNFMQLLVGVHRIEWDEEGKTLAVAGITPFIETDLGERWKIISDTEKPVLQDGVLVLDTEEQGRLSVRITFDDRSSVVGTSDHLFLPDLRKDSEAYLRVKEYVTQSRPAADPNGNVVKLEFGTPIKLVKSDGTVPRLWLIATSSGPAWIPEFYLTGSKKEIDFLQQNKMVPSTMTFVYKRDDIRLYGRAMLGPAVVESQGLGASSAGSRQAAFKDNAVLLHIGAVQHTWRNPMVFRSGGTTHQIAPNRLFYCTAVNDEGDGTFECIDLDTLALCKD